MNADDRGVLAGLVEAFRKIEVARHLDALFLNWTLFIVTALAPLLIDLGFCGIAKHSDRDTGPPQRCGDLSTRRFCVFA